MHYLFFLIVSLVWGSGFYLMKLAGFAFGPITIGASSTFGGAVFLWGFWAINRTKWNIDKKHIIPLLFIAFMGYAFPFVVQPFLVNRIGHGFVGMMVSLVPVLTIVVSIPILRLLPSKVQLVGVLVGIIGIGLMVFDGLERDAKPVYLLMAVSVPLFYAISNTWIQKSFQQVPPIIIAALLMTISMTVLIPLAVKMEQITINDRFTTAAVAMVLIAVLSRGLGMLLFYRIIRSKGPLFAGLVTYVIPVEALIWSWFDNEKVTITQVITIAIVLLMVGIVQRDIVRRSGSR